MPNQLNCKCNFYYSCNDVKKLNVLTCTKDIVFAYTEIFATINFDKLIFNTWYCDLYYEQC